MPSVTEIAGNGAEYTDGIILFISYYIFNTLFYIFILFIYSFILHIQWLNKITCTIKIITL